MVEARSVAVKSPYQEACGLVNPFLNDQAKEDMVFLLTWGEVARRFLGKHQNVGDYLDYGICNQPEVLSLARQFDTTITLFNQTAGTVIPDLVFPNITAVRSDHKIGPIGRIPRLLSKGWTVFPRASKAGVKAFIAQDIYMSNGEGIKSDTDACSRIHLEAQSPKHFLATLMMDLYPMILSRTGVYQELDSQELTRALCESLDTNTELFQLIKDQRWFTEEKFSKLFLDSLKVV